jgi:micrococcal nuclease
MGSTWTWEAVAFVAAQTLLACAVSQPAVTGQAVAAGHDARPHPVRVAENAGIPADAQAAVVASVIDGDTIRVRIAEVDEVVRLLEIDAPETGVGCGATQSTEFIRELVPPGSTVWLERDVEDRDRYGRLLRYVWRDDATLLNEMLVAVGWAEAKLYLPNDGRWLSMRQAQQVARDAGAGIWRLCDGSERRR